MNGKRAIAALLGGGALLAGIAAVFALLWGGTASAQGNEKKDIEIISFDFNAKETTVKLGTTVVFTNKSDRPHTATDRGGTFDTQPIQPNESASVTLTVPGTYSYFCRINPLKMNGTIKVEATPEQSKVVRVQALDDGNIEGEKLRFDPPTLSVQAGSTLLFANSGGKPHSLTAEDGSFTTGIVQPGPEKGRFAGGNATLTLSKPGTFNFYCDVHPAAMKGTITVTGAAVAGAPPPPSAGPRTADVAMEDFAFKENQISVAPGAEITYRNVGEAPHTATLDDVAGVDTGQIAPGQSGKLTAPLQPGSYSYKCTLHPGKMRATLVVLGQSTADPAQRVNVAETTTTQGGGSAAAPPGSSPTIAPSPPTGYSQASGAGGGMKAWVLVTAVAAAFLGGIGITPFLRRKATPAA